MREAKNLLVKTLFNDMYSVNQSFTPKLRWWFDQKHLISGVQHRKQRGIGQIYSSHGLSKLANLGPFLYEKQFIHSNHMYNKS